MIVSSDSVITDDGTFLPLDFLESAEVFARPLFTAEAGRVHFDDVRGLWVEGVYKENQILAYKSKTDIATSYQAFASSANFIVPVGVTSLRVIVVGAGAATGNNASGLTNDGTFLSATGGAGGQGGLAYGVITVTPGDTITVTVGAAVTNAGGGTSSFSTLTATGGARGGNGSTFTGAVNGADGANGVGSGGILNTTSLFWNSLFLTRLSHRIPDFYDSYNMYLKKDQSVFNTTAVAIPWSFIEDFRPGAGSARGTNFDGIGGAVIVFWS